MSFNFPGSPIPGDVFAPPGGPVWRWNGYGWEQLSTGEFVPEAPTDGTPYERQNAEWVPASGGGGGTDWADITGKPATFPPTLPIPSSGVTGLDAAQTAQDTAISGKEPTIAAGTSAQYWQGTKSWQTLDKAAVGLGNVDNVSDANKPVSTAQAAANALAVPLAGGTMTGKLVLPLSTTASASFNVGGNTGVSPTSPVDGDMWMVAGGNLQYRGGGTSYFTANTNGAQTFTGAKSFSAVAKFMSALATPAGGTTGSGITFGTTTNLGVFFGSGVPTLSAAQGSIYLRSDGTSTNTRVYVNTNGTTGWAAMSVIAVASSAPSSPATNDVWIDTT